MESQGDAGIARILKQRRVAFILVALSTLGTVFRGPYGSAGIGLADVLLIACLALGLLLWGSSKRMERKEQGAGADEPRNGSRSWEARGDKGRG